MYYDDMSEIAASWLILQKLTQLRTIRTAKDLEAVTALANKLADEVGDDITHPLFGLLDVSLTLIGAWESQNLDQAETTFSRCVVSMFSSRVCTLGTKSCDIEH